MGTLTERSALPARELAQVAIAAFVLAAISAAFGVYFGGTRLEDLGTVSLAEAARAPSRSLVRVEGDFDKGGISFDTNEGDTMFTLKGESHLVIVCLSSYRCQDILADDATPHVFAGRIYDLEADPGLGGPEFPRVSLERFATDELHVKPSEVKVLSWGEGKGKPHAPARIAFIVAGVLTLASLGLAIASRRKRPVA